MNAAEDQNREWVFQEYNFKGQRARLRGLGKKNSAIELVSQLLELQFGKYFINSNEKNAIYSEYNLNYYL